MRNILTSFVLGRRTVEKRCMELRKIEERRGLRGDTDQTENYESRSSKMERPAFTVILYSQDYHLIQQSDSAAVTVGQRRRTIYYFFYYF